MIGKIRVLIFTSILVVIFATVGFAFYFKFFILEKPLDIKAPGYVLLVKPGMSISKLAHQLEQEGFLSFPKLFIGWLSVSDLRGQLKAGEYLVKEGCSLQDIVKLLTAGKVIQHSLTIVEGWNFETLLQAVHQAPKLTHTLQGLTAKEIMAKLGHADEHPEGRFFPDTYHFPMGTTDLAFLQRAYQTMQDKLKNAWEKRGSELAVETPYQALILASIIEKESCYLEEYHEISGVFHRRLRLGMPLQADPTVIYGAGKAYKGVITYALLKLSNPYNTYLNTGLPPTPIAMPSERALLAATQPKAGNTLYFVAQGNCKGHIFSATLAEHQTAVNQYRRLTQHQQNSKVSLAQSRPLQQQTVQPNSNLATLNLLQEKNISSESLLSQQNLENLQIENPVIFFERQEIQIGLVPPLRIQLRFPQQTALPSQLISNLFKTQFSVPILKIQPLNFYLHIPFMPMGHFYLCIL